MAIHEFSTLSDAMDFFNVYQEKSKSGWRVCCCKHLTSPENSKPMKKEKLRVMWSHSPPKGISFTYDGEPFAIMGGKDWNCHQGKDLDRSKKARIKAERLKRDVTGNFHMLFCCITIFVLRRKKLHFCINLQMNGDTRRDRCQISKKVDCQAMVYLTHIVKYPAYRIEEDRIRARIAASKLLKTHIMEDKNVKFVHKYVLKLPSHNDHTGHPTYEMDLETHKLMYPERCKLNLADEEIDEEECYFIPKPKKRMKIESVWPLSQSLLTTQRHHCRSASPIIVEVTTGQNDAIVACGTSSNTKQYIKIEDQNETNNFTQTNEKNQT